MKRVVALLCVLGALAGGGVATASSASAESSRRICLYGKGFAASSSDKEYDAWEVIDYKKDGQCPVVNSSLLSAKTRVPVSYTQPVPKIACEELPGYIGGNPFDGADMCTRMDDDNVYVFYRHRQTGRLQGYLTYDDIWAYR